MKKINQEQLAYFKYAIDKKYPLKLKWFYDLFTFVADKEYEDEYIIIDKNNAYIKQEDKELLISGKYAEPLFDFKDEVTLPKGWLPNIKKDIVTTVGRMIMNYILLVNNFNDKIDYINKQFTVDDVEDIIKNKLSDEPKNDEISVPEYRKFIKSVYYINGFSNLINLTSTNKSILPAPGIDKVRKELLEKYKKKYGEEKMQDPAIIAQLEKELVDYDNQYLKGDPTIGKLLSGKVKNVARKKMYIMFGIGNAVDGDPKPVTYSLEDGWKKNANDLTTLYNDARGGSYSRGAETQQGGVVAKDTLRATSDIKILTKDCGSKVFIKTTLTPKNASNYLGRYINDKGKLTLLTTDNIDKYVGKTVNLRDPMTCKAAPHFCTICMGDSMKSYENGMSLIASGIGGTMLNESLKKFHGGNVEVQELDMGIFT